jgi:Lrp/AsnC family leucine-responsive transcriptional regulator
MIDRTDLQIINLLKENARLQWKEIGEIIHMTGQGVAVRIHRMEELGIIEKYTLKVNEKKLGTALTCFITVHMSTTDHKGFENFIKEWEGVAEAHRISGNGCYILKVVMRDTEELNHFLDLLLNYANYTLGMSIDQIKG